MFLLMLMVVLAAGTLLPVPLHAQSSPLPVPVGIPDGLPDDVRRDLSAQNARLTRAMYELRRLQERYQGLCSGEIFAGDLRTDPLNTHDCDNFRDQLARNIDTYTDDVEAFNQGIQSMLNSAEYQAMQHLNRGLQIFRSYYQGAWSGDSSHTGAKQGLDGAFDEFTRAMNLNPALAQTRYYRGAIFDVKNDVPSALDEYTAAVNLDPEGYQAYTARGIARAKLGDTAGAVSDFEAAIALAGDPVAYYNLARFKAKAGDCAGAAEDFNKAINLEFRFREQYKHEPPCKAKNEEKTGESPVLK
jgi:tetratricopeptide (TPR) repeat protein